MKTNNKSMLHEIFDANFEAEQRFRANKKQYYSATEIAYIFRFIEGESDLAGLFSESNLDLIKTLSTNK